ncbi:MAG: hypothetical protein RJA00_1511, partial [Bacteroidota bacterium]
MEFFSVDEYFVTVILSHEIGDGFDGVDRFGGKEVGGGGGGG